MLDRLFEVPGVESGRPSAQQNRSAVGRVAELLVTARLLGLGHKVAVPVVDDDGVDLVVNYRTTVQVKSTGAVAFGDRSPCYSFSLWGMAYSRAAGKNVRQRRSLAADAYVFHAQPEDRWWVCPADALRQAGAEDCGRVSFRLEPKNRIYRPSLEVWEDAWHVFEEESHARA